MSLNIKNKYSGEIRHSCIKGSYSLTLICLLFFLSFITNEISGQGNLLITPRRVVFEGSTRSIDLNLANTGSDTAIYAISLVQIRMKEDGGFETITEPDSGQMFADRNIRFFPRSVTLGPGETQVLKVQLYRTNQLKPGEYRSHFYFRAVPKVRPLGEEAPLVDSNAISVRLVPIFGITIPVIIRVGASTTSIKITNLKLDLTNSDEPVFSFIFRRSGNMSVYGDLTVDYISTQGAITRVAIANGVAVYTPNITRKFSLKLNRIVGVDYRSGTLRIIYSAPSDVKPVRFAEAELMLN